MENASSSDPKAVDATIVITTKNRKDMLRDALNSAVGQHGAIEILVIDDGSTDGTSDMVAREFPAVTLARRDESKGLIVRRNEGARLARGAIVFSMDDDAIFTTREIVQQTLRDFSHPRVGAVGIPFVNVNQNSKVHQAAPERSAIYALESYIGTAHAVRKELFLALGGYKETLFHQGEEGEFCARLLEAGYVVRAGTADVIHHMESPLRDLSRMHFYGARNTILTSWFNVPNALLPPHLAIATANRVRFGAKRRILKTTVKGIWDGYVNCVKHWDQRSPISYKSYRAWRTLRKAGSIPLENFESQLPAMRFGALTTRAI